MTNIPQQCYQLNAGCPTDGGEGSLVVSRRGDTGQLIIVCDECYVLFMHPEDVGSADSGFRIRVPLMPATKDEIVAAGWWKYVDEEPIDIDLPWTATD